MALTTRIITNVGDEIVDAKGALVSGETITFQLVLASDGVTHADVWDATTHERIVALPVTTTITNGIFVPVSLWPNDRGTASTQYLCTSSIATFKPFLSTLISGAGDLLWYNFYLNGAPAPGIEMLAFQAHMLDVDNSDASVHHTLGVTATTAARGDHTHAAAGTLTVGNGGTGRVTSTTAYALLAAGITATGAQQSLAVGATTDILVGGGATALPVWTTATGSGAPVRATSPTLVTPVLGTPTSGNFSSGTFTWPTFNQNTTGSSGSCTGNAATATTITGLSITSGKTFSVLNTLTFAGTDSTTITFPPVSSSIGYLDIPQNAQTGNYSTVAADSGKHIYHASGAAAATYTIVGANHTVGTAITFVNHYSASGAVTIAITTDTLRAAVSGTTGSRTLAVGGVATAIKIASSEWVISGSGLT